MIDFLSKISCLLKLRSFLLLNMKSNKAKFDTIGTVILQSELSTFCYLIGAKLFC